MKTLQNTIYLLLAILMLSCNTKPNHQITDVNDYNHYLSLSVNTKKILAQKELDFWQDKLSKQPGQYPYLGKIASANTQLFNTLGDINYLIAAQNNLQELNKKTNHKSSGSLRALARNYISQHKFKEALSLLEMAEIAGEQLHATQKMLFDVQLELGNYTEAEKYLSKIKSFSDFDYLIRAAKWNDHQGDLTTAIRYMEKAMTYAENSKNESLMVWAYTNLADFYGHNNEVSKAYKYYLKTLKLEPENSYAKKGIAWIAYSYEKNPDEALRIIDLISKEHPSPDYYLLKSEIAEFKNNLTSKKESLKLYLSAVNNTLYGDMYNQYNAKLYLDEYQNTKIALPIIEKEIQNRPTPQSYGLLAWLFFQKKEYNKALDIMNTYVVGKTYEPESLYHLAVIYKTTGFENKAKELKADLLESAFELGPLLSDKIQKL